MYTSVGTKVLDQNPNKPQSASKAGHGEVKYKVSEGVLFYRSLAHQICPFKTEKYKGPC